MKTFFRGDAVLLCFAFVGLSSCAQPGEAPGSGGSNGTGSGGIVNSGGTFASGGNVASGGIVGSGGVVASGGIVGAGGAAGTPGAGGTTTVVQKSCAAPFTVTTPVVADFESYMGTPITDPDNVLQWTLGPTTYIGAMWWNDQVGTSVVSFLAGNTGSWGLVHDYTPPAMCPYPSQIAADAPRCWGAASAFWMGCIDASAYQGLQLYARGTFPRGVLEVVLGMEDTDKPDPANSAGGGTCTVDPCTPPKYEWMITTPESPTLTTYTQIQIPWASFTGGMSGTTPVTVTGARITGMQFNVGLTFEADPMWVDPDPNTTTDEQPYMGVPADIDIQIDDVSFY